MDVQLRPELYVILSNTIILDTVINYLPLASRSALGKTSKTFKSLILDSSETFRLVDLSHCKGVYIPNIARIDHGGQSFRAERMDESLTEDEFYAGPLRGVLRTLHRRQILSSVHTLILDCLASVTNDLLHELLTSREYDVRLLSVRRCPNVNSSKLQQLLAYICRAGRPEGTPRLQGLYFFTDPHRNRTQIDVPGVTRLDGAQLGALPMSKSDTTDMPEYYAPSGCIIHLSQTDATFWAQTLRTCKGSIWFDAVLCTHMHVEMDQIITENIREQRPEMSPLATIALGPSGCTSCGRAPSHAPVWGQSEDEEFPLLWPPPASGRISDAIRPPLGSTGNQSDRQRLIVSCQWCVDNRHCDSCHKWWCADCYNPKKGKILQPVESPHDNPHLKKPANETNTIKIRKQLAVTRDCWECGKVCRKCAPLATRSCRFCKSEYCIYHNTGCDEDTVCADVIGALFEVEEGRASYIDSLESLFLPAFESKELDQIAAV